MVFKIKSIFTKKDDDIQANLDSPKEDIIEENTSAIEVSDSSASSTPSANISNSTNNLKKPKTLEELFLKHLPERFSICSEQLKQILQGKVLFEVLPLNRKFLIEMKENSCQVQEVSAEQTMSDDSTVENNNYSFITMHGKDLLRVASGDLNPQVLMLSHKVRLSGPARLVTYIFNLICPYQENHN